MNLNPLLAVAGPHVTDLQPHSPTRSSTAKRDGDIELHNGGAAAHCARFWQSLGVPAAVQFFTGTDPAAAFAHALAMEEFPTARTCPALVRSRLSILDGDQVLTVRSSLKPNANLDAVLKIAHAAELFVVPPFTSADESQVRSLLTAARRNLLLQSKDQLSDRATTYARMQFATVSIMNDAEARLLTGESDIVEALQQIAASVRRTVIVTFETGVLAGSLGVWTWQPGFVPHAVKQTIGAGDTFSAAFAVPFSQGETLEASLTFGLIAAARYVEKALVARSISELQDAAVTRPRNPNAPHAATGRWVLDQVAPYLRNPQPVFTSNESAIPGMYLG